MAVEAAGNSFSIGKTTGKSSNSNNSTAHNWQNELKKPIWQVNPNIIPQNMLNSCSIMS